MTKMTNETIKQILNLHKKWMETDEQEGECASFAFADLSGYDFSNMDLEEVSFFKANLTGADFSNSILKGVEFFKANLTNCNFSNSVLTCADMEGADLTNCNFSDATGIDIEDEDDDTHVKI